MERKTVTISLTLKEKEMLDTITAVYGTTQSDFLKASIKAEFDKIQGNPKILEIMNKLNDLKALLDTKSK